MTLKLTYAGFNYVYDYNGAYANADSLPTMIAQTASNAVAIVEDYGIDAATSTIFADYTQSDDQPGYTESTDDITATITAAEADGLSVMVRPLIDFLPDETATMLTSGNGVQYPTTAAGGWRADYMPTNATTFFDSYDSTIVALAAKAQAAGAQIFDIGTELDGLTGTAYQSDWSKIIGDVRKVFFGKLTYSAISDDDLSPWQGGTGDPTQPPAGTGDLATQVSFWSDLDYVGIDEYAAISDVNSNGSGTDPTLAQLVAGWEDTPTDPTTDRMTGGLSLIQYYENVAATLHKPLLFTEIGYQSAPGAAASPAYTGYPTYDPTLQANLYKAFLTAWQAQGNTSLEGVYLWNWEPDPTTDGIGSSPNFTPQDDTGSLQAVDLAFTAATACFAAGTRIATREGECAVEHLSVGGNVLTATGAPAAIAWLGHRRVDCRRHPRPAEVWPFRVKAHAFAEGQPHCDLLLSPDHAVFVGGALIPIRYLANDATIVQERRDVVIYWHVELARHDVILAEGLPCESYLDTGNRAAFANGRDCVDLHPDFARGAWDADGCAPLVVAGPRPEAARARLRGRNVRPRRTLTA